MKGGVSREDMWWHIIKPPYKTYTLAGKLCNHFEASPMLSLRTMIEHWDEIVPRSLYLLHDITTASMEASWENTRTCPGSQPATRSNFHATRRA